MSDHETIRETRQAQEDERRRERVRRAAEDGERLYQIRMHAPDGPTIKDDFRIDGILTLDLVDALGFVDNLAKRLAAMTAQRDELARVIGSLHEIRRAAFTPEIGVRYTEAIRLAIADECLKLEDAAYAALAAVEAQRDELARALRVIAPAADEACVILRSLAASMERDELSSPALRQRIRDAAVALRAALAAAGDAE